MASVQITRGRLQFHCFLHLAKVSVGQKTDYRHGGETRDGSQRKKMLPGQGHDSDSEAGRGEYRDEQGAHHEAGAIPQSEHHGVVVHATPVGDKPYPGYPVKQ